MLNFIYYPVSAILWFWHKVFGFVLGPASGIAWALSVVFLVFTLRALLFKPFVNQVKTQRQMQEFQPQIKALQKKYAGDRQRLAVEMQKLQKENGFNPIAGCLPVLAQAPVFIGLFHVLRSFNRTGTSFGQLGLTPEENANTSNYVFSVADVQSFLDAKLFGAPLAAQISATADQLAVYTGEVTRVDVALVAVPLMVVAAIATHFTARASVARQAVNPAAAGAAGSQAAIMNKLVLWVFPFFVLVGGPFLPVAILLYWLSNNGWTLVQQHYVFAGMTKLDEKKKAEAAERRTASAPKPGARPVNTKKSKAVAPVADEVPADRPNLVKGTDGSAGTESGGVAGADTNGSAGKDTGGAGGTEPGGSAGARRNGGGAARGPGGSRTPVSTPGGKSRTTSNRGSRKKR